MLTLLGNIDNTSLRSKNNFLDVDHRSIPAGIIALHNLFIN